MKTGTPVTPILNDHGHRIADLTFEDGRAWIEFSSCAGKFDVDAIDGIVDLMKKKELDQCATKL